MQLPKGPESLEEKLRLKPAWPATSYRPTINAVIVHLSRDDSGEMQRIVSIECADKDMLPALEEEARRLLEA